MPESINIITSALGGVGGLGGLIALIRSHFQIGINRQMIEELKAENITLKDAIVQLRIHMEGVDKSLCYLNKNMDDVKKLLTVISEK